MSVPMSTPGESNHANWLARQARIERYRRRLEEGKGIFSETQDPEKPMDILLAELAPPLRAKLVDPRLSA